MFRAMMRAMEREGRVELWDDTTIQPGANWARELSRSLENAQVVVLLVSANFLASDFLSEEQLPIILKRGNAGEVKVVPILLSPTSLPPGLAKFSSLPVDGTSIAEQPDRERAWVEAAAAVSKIASEIEGQVWSETDAVRLLEDKPLDTRTIVRALKRAGFEVQRRTESHYVLRDDSEPPRIVAVPRGASSIGGGLRRQILRAAAITEAEFQTLISGP